MDTWWIFWSLGAGLCSFECKSLHGDSKTFRMHWLYLCMIIGIGLPILVANGNRDPDVHFREVMFNIIVGSSMIMFGLGLFIAWVDMRYRRLFPADA